MNRRSGLFFIALVLATGCGSDTVPPATPGTTIGVVEIPSETSQWLNANAHPFSGSHLSLPHDDLEFLHDIVGDARIVALGQNTYGTRDFHEMKARILRFLVEEMGFNTLAFEAGWPESRRIDHYVRTGEGNPRKLLSGLYFWGWNTESVLEMIEWMRDHNEGGGDVGFHGFDPRLPGMALHNLIEYIGLVDPDAVEEMTEKVHCLASFANDHRGDFPMDPGYEEQPETYLSVCRTSLDEAHELLLAKQEQYEAVSGKDAFEVALQSLRVAIQVHLLVVGEQSLSRLLAENTEWISRRMGPEGRMVLWAHNYSVSSDPGFLDSQAFYLRQTFGDALVTFGFSHERGRFTAVRVTDDTLGDPEQFDLSEALEGSWEHHFSTATAPRFVLDLRTNNPGSEWLNTSRPLRLNIGLYDPDESSVFWWRVRPRDRFDVIIYFESTRATTVLPFLYPDSW